MKQTFAIGRDIDVLTPAEMEAATDKVVAAVLALDGAPMVDREPVTIQVDANGNVGGGATGAGLPFYRCPLGRRVDINRLSLWAETYTPGGGSLTSGWLMAVRNNGGGPPVFIWPGSGSIVLPSVYDDGDSAPRLNGGERLVAVGAGLPVNLQIFAELQVRVWPDYPARPRDTRSR